MAKKSKGVPPGQTEVPQVERYTGSDVLGMEYTTARPMAYETGADSNVFLPEPCHRPVFCHYAQIKGKKVATLMPYTSDYHGDKDDD